ncbi:serine hydrolase domain-containing protein [Streptomyces sp. NBC_01264]|uniref:serine hydrolase domain-containing protein n=1 Tax=Streptomyces sp. NBC_01264 TaxID=2903804 RepID=UPI002254F1A0|nr:serine hydrolase domain-containing protein [Streptomyces sp. NBC_01264]MCX4782189.1 beta-lactamase family protein [Streptomyces sp. NBC_01264]
MTGLADILQPFVDDGTVPGAVALVDRGDGKGPEVAAVGSADAGGGAPMVRDSIFRMASLTKPVTAAAVMMLVEDGRFALTDAVAPWLPEIAEPVVVRTPASPVDDVVPAKRAVTVADLMTFRAGWGFPSDFALPAVAPLFGELRQGPPRPQDVAAPDEWMAALGRIPMLYQPGEAWLYNTCSDVLGVLIARVAGCSLPEFLAERIFEPLDMPDTGFAVPAGQSGRFTHAYRAGADGGLDLVDAPDGQWSAVPAFPSGAGGLVSTADDYHRFARMLLDGGGPLLSADSVRRMTTDWLTPAQRAGAALFLEGQGWGFGGSVDVTSADPWNVPGRYGWLGGTGTAAHVVPSTGAVTVLLTQRELTGPSPAPETMRAVWAYAAS